MQTPGDVNEPSMHESAGLPAAAEAAIDMRPLIASVVRAINGAPGTAQGAFEAALSQVLPLRSVRVREGGLRRPDGAEAAGGTSLIALDLPGVSRGSAVLEASLGLGHTLSPQVRAALDAAAAVGAVVLEVERARAPKPVAGGPPPAGSGTALVGRSPLTADLRQRIARVAASNFTVLVEGESGTGKELVARHLHDLSRRRHGPFVAVNCAAIVETLLEAELFGIEERTATGVRGRRGKFELADRGTLFLDEVSDLSPAAQAKLLRAIQELAVERVGGHGTRRVDVRIVAASNRPLADLVAQGVFRPDLFYRLSGVEVSVPPLRTRSEDVPLLVRHFLDRHEDGRDMRITDAAVEALRLYAWPGNVRELERLIERLVALARSTVIEVDDLPPHVRGAYAEVLEVRDGQDVSLRAWGARYVRLVYERCGRNKRRTCQELGISYHTLSAYLRCGDPAALADGRPVPAWVARSCSTGPVLAADVEPA